MDNSNNYDIEVAQVAPYIFIGILTGIFIGVIIGCVATSNYFRNEAIDQGCAKFDKSGNWEWKYIDNKEK